MSTGKEKVTRPSTSHKATSIRPMVVHSSDATSPSLLLCFDQSRYLFDCPENTSRSFVQSRINQKHLSSIFLSSSGLSYSGGLYGILHSLAELNKQKVNLIGPKGLSYMLACGRLFTRKEGMSVELIEFRNQGTLQKVFSDDLINVFSTGPRRRTPPAGSKRKATPPSSEQPDKRTKMCSDDKDASALPDGGCHPDHTKRLDDIIKDMFRPKCSRRNHRADGPPLNRTTTPAWSYEKLEPQIEWSGTDPVSYLIIGPRSRGKFLPKKAQELGVKPGPNFSALVNGGRVQVDGGRWVEGEMCMEGGSAGPAFLISNVNSTHQLASMELIDPENIANVSDGAELMAVYHFVHEDVISDERYMRWIDKLGVKTKHYLSTPSHCPDLYTFEPSVVAQMKLHLISPNLLSIPYHCTTPALQCPSPILNVLKPSDVLSLNDFKSQAPDLATVDYQLIGRQTTDIELITELKLTKEFTEALNQTRQNIMAMNSKSKQAKPADDITVTTLGTGSAVPSKYRNVSSTLLQIPPSQSSGLRNILLDAGEGTLGQIRRKFGLEWKQVLKDLKLVFISHLHADHHSGLASLLSERFKLAQCEPLVLVCQRGVHLYLEERSDIESLGLFSGLVNWVDSDGLLDPSATGERPGNMLLQELSSQGIELETVLVTHRGRCYGLCIQNRVEGWKIVFSGDTEPNEGLIRAGQGADLLIHEATFGPGEESLAHAKGHSTIDQAIEVGLKMKARNCLLNHFSGRYPKIPPTILKPKNHLQQHHEDMNIGISFDLMSCKIGEMDQLEACLNAFELVFVKEAETKSKIDPVAIKQVGKKKSKGLENNHSAHKPIAKPSKADGTSDTIERKSINEKEGEAPKQLKC